MTGSVRRAGWARLVLLAVLAVLVAGLGSLAVSAVARADGDPGSDELVFDTLFTGSDSGLSFAQQEQLGALLGQTRRAGAPVRVAIIAHRDDLGVVTGVWQKPIEYAEYLGLELEFAYPGRLLVVMPDGFGLSSDGGHVNVAETRALDAIPIRPGAAGLVAATEAAVRRVEAGAGVTLPARAGSGAGSASSSASSSSSGATASGATGPAIEVVSGGSRTGQVIWLIALAAVALLLLGVVLVRRRRFDLSGAALSAGALAILATAAVVGSSSTGSVASAGGGLATNPNLDPGGVIPGKPAPDFTLTDQFGRRFSLGGEHGKVVLLAFTDAECTTICPLTTAAMLDAKRSLGAAGNEVALVGVDTNQKSTSLQDVLSYSELHGLTSAWRFGTGPVGELIRIWNEYGVYHDITGGLISHTPALFVIDPTGRIRRLFITQSSYAAIPQLGQLLAREASALLPNHPAVHSDLGYGLISGVSRSAELSLPRSGGGRVLIGPGDGPRLYVFFATWDQEVSGLAGELDELNRYAAAAAQGRLPKLTAIDEGSVEPGPGTLPAFLRTLPRPLRYPVAIDATGRVADGYEVEGQPWFVETSSSGRIVWYSDGYTSGWPSLTTLEHEVRAGLAAVPGGPVSAAAAQRALRGSPSALASLHAQASRLLGGQTALDARVRALRGYPIVVNVWGSWCAPCQAEFGLLKNASVRYGRKVAFLGADYNDEPGNAQAFLSDHYVAYPSYQTSSSSINALLPQGVFGTPETVFISPSGKQTIVHVNIGQYTSQGTLDADIEQYALG